MAPTQAEGDLQENGGLRFFGAKLKVKNPRLAALLNSDVSEDVEVIGARAWEALAGAGAADDSAQHEVEQRVLHADDSVRIRRDEVDGA